eukprot:185911-Prorocentrum_minimum.AAC.3
MARMSQIDPTPNQSELLFNNLSQKVLGAPANRGRRDSVESRGEIGGDILPGEENSPPGKSDLTPSLTKAHSMPARNKPSGRIGEPTQAEVSLLSPLAHYWTIKSSNLRLVL